MARLALLSHLDTVDPELGGNVSQRLDLVLGRPVVQIVGRHPEGGVRSVRCEVLIILRGRGQTEQLQCSDR